MLLAGRKIVLQGRLFQVINSILFSCVLLIFLFSCSDDLALNALVVILACVQKTSSERPSTKSFTYTVSCVLSVEGS